MDPKNLIFLIFFSCSVSRDMPIENKEHSEQSDTVIDTNYNPKEEFYILNDGTIIDGVELERRIDSAWQKAFKNLTEEEKKLFKDVIISIDTTQAPLGNEFN